jgi:hypothetical protein
VIVVKQSGKIIFGMKLLAQHFISVDYSLLDANGAVIVHESIKNGIHTVHEELKKALFYSPNEQEEYIITDTFMLKDEDELRIHTHDDNFSVTLKNRKNVGLGYWQFECVRIKEKKKHAPTATKKGYDFI